MAAVAQRARVTKPTVYLRWPSKVSLVAEAVAEVLDLGTPPDTGSLRGDLLALLKVMIHGLARTSAGRILEGLIADLHRYPDLMVEFRKSYFEPRWRLLAIVLERYIARGEIAGEVDIEVLTDLLVGPIYYRLLVRAEPPRFELQQKVVDLVLAGLQLRQSCPDTKRRIGAKKATSSRKARLEDTP
jgi:AcrR family transcriptional regulator